MIRLGKVLVRVSLACLPVCFFSSFFSDVRDKTTFFPPWKALCVMSKQEVGRESTSEGRANIPNADNNVPGKAYIPV